MSVAAARSLFSQLNQLTSLALGAMQQWGGGSNFLVVSLPVEEGGTGEVIISLPVEAV